MLPPPIWWLNENKTCGSYPRIEENPILDRLLIIDDDPDIRASMRDLAEGEGFTCEEAAHGKEALQVLKTFPADVIVVDLHMPLMDGPEMIEKIYKTNHEYTPIIIAMSGYLEKYQDRLGEKINHIIAKPPDYSYIKNLLRRYKHTAENPEEPIALLVEDSDIYKAMLRQTLQKTGWKVMEADDGEQAVKVLSFFEGVQLVITDLNMPNMSGVDFIKKVRTQGNDVSIVVISSDISEIDKVKADITNWIVKPASPEAIEMAIKAGQRKAS